MEGGEVVLGTVLSIAVSRGLAAAARALLEGGADQNLPDADGGTQLIRAATGGLVKLLRLLLAHGAVVDAVLIPPGEGHYLDGVRPTILGESGYTAFHAACCWNQADCAELLVLAGCDVDLKKMDATIGNLAEATMRDNPAVLKRLKSLAKNPLSGVVAELRGLVSAPEHNGQRAAVRCHLPAKGRFELELLWTYPNQTISVKPANIELVVVPVGLPVQVHGLVGAAEHNGKQGVVESRVGENGRCGVRLPGRAKPLGLKPANLALYVNVGLLDGNNPLAEQLVQAAHEGDRVALSRLLAARADPNASVPAHTPSGEVQTTALCVAAAYGYVETVRLLLEAGADPSLARSDGATPLRQAAGLGHVDVVRLLLARGAAVDAVKPGTGCTAFHAACYNNHPECAEAMARAGCDVGIKDQAGKTGWDMAEQKRHAGVVARLQSLETERPSSAGGGRTRLVSGTHEAAEGTGAEDQRAAAQAVEARKQAAAKCRSEGKAAEREAATAEREAARAEERKIRHLNPQCQAEVRANRPASPPVAADKLEVGRYRVRFYNNTIGAVELHYVGAKAPGGRKLMYTVPSGGRFGCFAVVDSKFTASNKLATLATWMTTDEPKQTYFVYEPSAALPAPTGAALEALGGQLYDAAVDGDGPAVSRLLAAGADPNMFVTAEDRRDRTVVQVTALSEAAHSNNLEVVRLLLKGGADPELARSDGGTPLMIAAEHGQSEVLQLLLGVTPGFRDGAWSVREDGRRVGIETVSTSKNGHRRTAFHFACFNNQPDCAEVLMQAGCDVGTKDINGETGAEVAERLGHAAVVARLIRVAQQMPGRGAQLTAEQLQAVQAAEGPAAGTVEVRPAEVALARQLWEAAGDGPAVAQWLAAGADPNVLVPGRWPCAVKSFPCWHILFCMENH
jgi:ankyrin repeat protein